MPEGSRDFKSLLKPKNKKKGFEGRWLYLPSELHLYADGSSSHISRDGGWAFIIYDESKGKVLTQKSGFINPSTNNAMEIKAIAEGLKWLENPSVVKVYSDSAYVINTMNHQWWKEWEKNNWMKHPHSENPIPTPNAALWQELIKVTNFHTAVEFVKVKGHGGDKMNELCDKLAKQARKRQMVYPSQWKVEK